MKRTLLPVLLALFILAGCTGDPPTATVVMEENTAIPTLTAAPLPTDTPPPTATDTPEPTPTFTPTAPPPSPAPTETPPPTDVPTSTPEPTMPPTVAPQPTPAVTPTNTIDLRTTLRDQITVTMLEVGNYRGIITGDVRVIPNVGVFHGSVDCVATVESYDRLVGGISLDLSGNGDPVVQNAYNVARAAIDQFITIAKPWTDGCREALAEGILEKSMDKLQRDAITQALKLPDDTFNQAYHILDE